MDSTLRPRLYIFHFLQADSHIVCRAHAAPMPCSDHAVLLKATAQHGRRETAMLCHALSGRAWQGKGMEAAWAWPAMCESAFTLTIKLTLRQTCQL